MIYIVTILLILNSDNYSRADYEFGVLNLCTIITA